MTGLIVPVVHPNIQVTLNIGLGTSIAWGNYKRADANHYPVLSLVDILDTPYRIARILERIQDITTDLDSVRYRTVQSNSEMTLVVQFDAVGRELMGQVFTLAERLQQDCIAVWVHNQVNGGFGQLIGRYNYVWGAFNPEYFIHLENESV